MGSQVQILPLRPAGPLSETGGALQLHSPHAMRVSTAIASARRECPSRVHPVRSRLLLAHVFVAKPFPTLERHALTATDRGTQQLGMIFSCRRANRCNRRLPGGGRTARVHTERDGMRCCASATPPPELRIGFSGRPGSRSLNQPNLQAWLCRLRPNSAQDCIIRTRRGAASARRQALRRTCPSPNKNFPDAPGTPAFACGYLPRPCCRKKFTMIINHYGSRGSGTGQRSTGLMRSIGARAGTGYETFRG